MEHELKIDQQYLDNLLSGKKKAEIRFNDRDYQVGDTLLFKDYSLVSNIKKYRFKITHIHSGLGMKEVFVCLSVERLEAQE